MLEKLLRTVAAFALVSGLFCMAGCSEEKEIYSAADTEYEADETTIDGNMMGAYYQSSSYTAENDEYETIVFSAEEIEEIYTFTLEGVTYTLPCAASEFAAAGWAPKETLEEMTVAAKHYKSSPVADGGYYLEGCDANIGLHLVNTSNKEKNWTECMVVGITVLGTDYDFELSTGIRVGDTWDVIQAAYGASSYDVDRYGNIGYNFGIRLDESLEGYNWYGEAYDTLTFLSNTKTLYASWDEENIIDTIRLEFWGDIEPSEAD